MSSSKGNGSTFWLVLIFMVLSASYLFIRLNGSEEKAGKTAGGALPAREAFTPPEPPRPYEDGFFSHDRDVIWSVLNAMPDAPPTDATARLGYALGLILPPDASEEEIRTGLELLIMNDVDTYGMPALVASFTMPGNEYIHDRMLEKLLTMTERRGALIKSVLADYRRINAYCEGYRIPLESEAWPRQLQRRADTEAVDAAVLPPGGLVFPSETILFEDGYGTIIVPAEPDLDADLALPPDDVSPGMPDGRPAPRETVPRKRRGK